MALDGGGALPPREVDIGEPDLALAGGGGAFVGTPLEWPGGGAFGGAFGEWHTKKLHTSPSVQTALELEPHWHG